MYIVRCAHDDIKLFYTAAVVDASQTVCSAHAYFGPTPLGHPPISTETPQRCASVMFVVRAAALFLIITSIQIQLGKILYVIIAEVILYYMIYAIYK